MGEGKRGRAGKMMGREIMEGAGEDGMPDLAHVMRILSAENISNLPPGGGLAGKRHIIETVYNRLNPHRENDGDPSGAEKTGARGTFLEALRELRVNHRGNYRQLLEEMLIKYRLSKMQGTDSTAGPSFSSQCPPDTPMAGSMAESENHVERKISDEDSAPDTSQK